MPRGIPNPDLFEHYMPVPESGCWLWLGDISKKGYGQLRIEVNGKRVHTKAHRISWVRTYGPIPKGMHVCHKCDVPSCINPNHLFLGNDKDNMADKIRKGRHLIAIKKMTKKNYFSHGGNITLTPDDVRDIRIRLNRGEKHKSIADIYKVRYQSIGKIKAGITWSHVK